MSRLYRNTIKLGNQTRNITVGFPKYDNLPQKVESDRMKKFHQELKLEKIPRVSPAMRYIDLVLVDTNPSNGELIPNTEKEPTKWGDWQHNGRVTDF